MYKGKHVQKKEKSQSKTPIRQTAAFEEEPTQAQAPAAVITRKAPKAKRQKKAHGIITG